MPKLYFGSRGGMYYKRKGRKVYVKRHQSSFGMTEEEKKQGLIQKISDLLKRTHDYTITDRDSSWLNSLNIRRLQSMHDAFVNAESGNLIQIRPFDPDSHQLQEIIPGEELPGQPELKKQKTQFGMDYAVPGVLGGLGQGYVDPDMMYSGFGWWPFGKSKTEKIIDEIIKFFEKQGSSMSEEDISFLREQSYEKLESYLNILKNYRPINDTLEWNDNRY